MSLKTIDEFLNILPSMYELDLNCPNAGVMIFNKLSKVLDFDEGFIYFLNSDSLQLKYSFKKHSNYKVDEIFLINDNQKRFIYSKDSAILDKNSDFIKIVNLDSLNKKSYIVAKIFIKSVVFGVILLAKKELDYYSQIDLSILTTSACILSYALKDKELSDVFRIQLKALKDGIVEKQQAYKVIKEQNEKILEADRAKNEFLANVSHELRTPLNSILGFADILSTKLYGELNFKQAEYVDDIKVSATHLLGMINEVLDMSKLEANAMKLVKSKFMITRAIDEVCNIVQPLADKKQICITRVLNSDFEVFADYQKIQQILYNLVSNAIKFTPLKGQIDVTATVNNENFKLVVHDNGIGIDPKYHGKIFAKFVQLDSAYTKKESSTGLGLTITKELAELHGGKVSLISEINNGSTFIVEIPQ